MILRQLLDYETFTYTYLVADEVTKEAIIIDPVREQLDRDLKLIRELGFDLKYSLETHVHADHITSADSLRKETGSKTVLGLGANVECSDIKIQDGETLDFGSYSLKAIATPGHTNACTSYLIENFVFTGDTLFIRGTGRTDFQGGSAEALYDSIKEKLFTLNPDTIVYPGHDYKGMTSSTIAEEKLFNPRIDSGMTKEEFVEIMANLNLAQPKKIQEAVPANIKCGKEVKL